jgi:hypothetical protein
VEGRQEGRGRRFYLLEAAELGVSDCQEIQQVGGFRIEAGQRPVWAVCQKQCPQQQQQVELAFG